MRSSCVAASSSTALCAVICTGVSTEDEEAEREPIGVETC